MRIFLRVDTNYIFQLGRTQHLLSLRLMGPTRALALSQQYFCHYHTADPCTQFEHCMTPVNMRNW